MKKSWTPYLNGQHKMLNALKERGKYFTALFLCALMLSNCSIWRARDMSADHVVIPKTSSSTDTMREACVRACDRDHDTCNAGPSARDEAFDAPKQILGASAACDQAFRDCLRYCK